MLKKTTKNKWAENANNIMNGDCVVYFTGAKSPLIGKYGYVQTIPDKDGIVMVEFCNDGEIYPCWVGNLIHADMNI